MDDLDEYRETSLQDPDFRAAYEDAEALAGLFAALIARRKDQGLRQRDVARSIGGSQASVSKFECSGPDAPLSALMRYARAVGARIRVELVTPDG